MKAMRFLILICLSLILAGTAHAGPKANTAKPAAAGPFIEELGNRALSILAETGSNPEAIKTKFRSLILENFDIPGIAKFVLGRNWKLASEAQRAEYSRLFQKMVEQIYSDRFSAYSGETFSVTGERDEGDDKIVTTKIIRPSAPEVMVDWRIRPGTKNKLLIADVIVEGVSMAITQRSEFASVIQRNGGDVEGLLKELRTRVGEAAPGEKANIKTAG